ncbi:conserved hypothetical protein [uncultured Alphaproteobacteria bacterium]|uniref:Uncharacterized protein n=1 Tax=uncultured Alphaproteobacteria bacterium TaxID=91750 RepID=A0A212J5Q7_9PROT|nr:conserved hypothetical protein [uncultured Alphaproteobacteria bacterium]
MTTEADAPALAAPTPAQIKWLHRGLSQAGGKLPLFDETGRRVSGRMVRTCIARGWAEPWFANPLMPNWLVCRLTEDGRRLLADNLAESQLRS